jgi:large subunit ribosomal protein L18
MDRLRHKKVRLERRRKRVKSAIISRNPRPRLVFNRSNRYLACQLIDDQKGLTICAASTNEKDFSGPKKNKEAAEKLGKMIAERAKEKGVKSVALDRRGILYHGRIAAFADAARENGLEF